MADRDAVLKEFLQKRRELLRRELHRFVTVLRRAFALRREILATIETLNDLDVEIPEDEQFDRGGKNAEDFTLPDIALGQQDIVRR